MAWQDLFDKDRQVMTAPSRAGEVRASEYADEQKKRQDFLNKMAFLESTNNPMVRHPDTSQGRAMGTYGIMPNTLKEMLDDKKITGQEPKFQDISRTPQSDREQYIQSHPDIEKALADALAAHINRQQGDLDNSAAYGWQYGHNLTPDRMENRTDSEGTPWEQTDRVKRFQELQDPESKRGQDFIKLQNLLNQKDRLSSNDEQED